MASAHTCGPETILKQVMKFKQARVDGGSHYDSPRVAKYIEGSKSSVAINAWLPQASNPCGNFPDTSS